MTRPRIRVVRQDRDRDVEELLGEWNGTTRGRRREMAVGWVCTAAYAGAVLVVMGAAGLVGWVMARIWTR